MIRARPLTLGLLGFLALATPSRAEPVKVMLDWFVNPDHAPLIVALEKGYFKEAGLEVELIAPADPHDPPKLAAVGSVDIAVDYQPSLHIQVDQGLPLIRFGTLVATPLSTLVVLEKGPIKTIADLKGKKVGYSVGGVENGTLKVMFEKAGFGLADVTLVNVNFSLTPALLTGQVDAVIGAYRNFELNQLAEAGSPGRAFYLEENGVPVYDELILVANRDIVKTARVAKFLDALERGVLFLQNHPDDSWKLFISHHRELDDTLNKKAWADTLPRFSADPAALDHARYARYAAFLKAEGLIKEIVPVDSYAVEIAR